MEILFFKIYLFCFVLQFVIILILGWSYCKKEKFLAGKPIAVSVIIPFRDESDRIMGLIQSINMLKLNDQYSVEFLFVNDHSADKSEQLISEHLRLTHRIIQNKATGKKNAIKTGVEAAQYDEILTWDADILVAEDYFLSLSKLQDADMWILPVRMESEHFLGKLAAIDFSWLQMMTYVFCRWKSPFLANGANLFFKKAAFVEAERNRDDYDIASGDDLFLLYRFNEMKKDVRAYHNASLMVETKSPENIHEMISQRKRWSGKMKGMMELQSGLLFLMLLFFMAVFIATVVHAFVFFHWLFVALIGLKVVNEYILLRFYNGAKYLFKDLLLVLVHQVFFPVYLLGILLSKSQSDTRWEH